MTKYVRVLLLAVLALPITAFAQQACGTTGMPGPCPEDSFQVTYASNLPGFIGPIFSLGLGASLINATNSGANASTSGPLGFTGGNICMNLYVFDPGEEELTCCSCMVTPNALVSTDVGSLINSAITTEGPTSAIVKVLATSADGLSSCADSAENVTSTSPGTTNNLVSGLRAWSTTLHTMNAAPGGTPFGVEKEFAHAGDTLSQGELNRMVNYCAFIIANGSGHGLCKGCNIPAGGL